MPSYPAPTPRGLFFCPNPHPVAVLAPPRPPCWTAPGVPFLPAGRCWRSATPRGRLLPAGPASSSCIQSPRDNSPGMDTARRAAPGSCFTRTASPTPGGGLPPYHGEETFSLGLALRVALCHAQREGGGGRTAIGKREKRLSFLYSCANVNARQSVVIVRNHHY